MNRAVFLPSGRLWPRNDSARRRVGVAVRTLSAVVGGYLLSSLVSAVLAKALPMPRVDAVVTGMLVALVVMPCAVMWSFAARSALRAWVGLLVPSAVLVAVLLIQRVGA